MRIAHVDRRRLFQFVPDAGGLLAAVWTNDLSRAHRVAAEVDAGQVFVNTYGAGGGVELPFGGFKQSGYGKDLSMYSVEDYTVVKHVMANIS